MTCITRSVLKVRLSHAFEAIHYHSVGFLTAIGTRKWSSVKVDYVPAYSWQFTHALHVGGCGLDLSKVEQPLLPHSDRSLRKRVCQANYA